MKVCVTDAGLGGQGIPVAGTGFVESDDEVVDGFGLWGDLAEGDAVAQEGGSGKVLVGDGISY